MSWIALASAAITAAGEASKGGNAPPVSQLATTNQVFDNSGWTVNYGSGSIDATRSQSQPTIGGGQLAGAASPSALGGVASQYIPFAMMAVGLLVIWKLAKKK